MIPGTTAPLDEVGKRTIRAHWKHVHEASGQPFDFSFFDREGFVYDTEPASRAVVAVRRSGKAALAYLDQVQAAFYARNCDVTDGAVLAELATDAGLDREDFLQAFRSDAVKRETWTDFTIAQRAGITGFPTLLAGTGDESGYSIVTQGYQPAERLIPPLEQWMRGRWERADADRPSTPSP